MHHHKNLNRVDKHQNSLFLRPKRTLNPNWVGSL
jgi:hypothetical protein